MNLEEVALGVAVTVRHVGGERPFRRRLMELGILPGTRVEVIRVAPLGDPIELRVRGCLLSIRRAEARCIAVAEGAVLPSHGAPIATTPAVTARAEAARPPPVGIQPGLPASP